MSKTITDDKYKKTAKLITEKVEPRIRVIVDEVNKVLAKDGVRAGVELQWFFDSLDSKEERKV